MDISKSMIGRLDPAGEQPLYLQLAEAIAARIRDHSLAPGTKLPPERELAQQFAVSRTTAINVYRELERQELVRTKVGSGTYVADQPHPGLNSQVPWQQLFVTHSQSPLSSILRELVAPAGTGHISLAAGMADPALYPLADLEAIIARHFAAMDPAALGHIGTEGYQPLREILARRAAQQGMAADSGNIMTLAGSQQGLYLVCKAFLEPGDYVIVQAPTFIGAIQVFQTAGARIISLPAEPAFPLALLEDYLVRYRPKLMYLIPTFQNPTGESLTLHDRKEVLRLAARHRLAILEDDPYSELWYETPAPPSLKSLDTYGGVIYLSTFSKTVLPGFRLGWLMAPPAVINRLAYEKQYVDLHSNNLAQWLIAFYLTEGLYEEHLKTVRKEYKKRRDVLFLALQRLCGEHLSFAMPEGGFYLWCQLRPGPRALTSRALLHEAAKQGLSFAPGEAFYADQKGENQLRLCFTSHPAPDLMEGAKRLRKCLTSFPDLSGREQLAAEGIKPLI